MKKDIHSHHKALLKPLRQALYDYEPESVKKALKEVFVDNALVKVLQEKIFKKAS